MRAARSDNVSGDLGALVFLGGLRRGRDDVAIAREAFHAARALAGRGSFVTVGRVGRAGLGALARTCAKEWPDVAAKAVEVEYGDEDVAAVDVTAVAAALAAELLGGDAAPDIVLHADGRRSARRMVPCPARPPASATLGGGRSVFDSESVLGLGPESVVVVTGGGRGITAACARALARAFRPRIALIGRTPLAEDPPELRGATTEAEVRAALVDRAVRAGGRPRPAAIEAEVKRVRAVREIRDTLADIARAGSAVRYFAADVADREALGAALREVRAAWGPVTAVVHGAGVLADRLIADKTDEQFERVVRAKADGFRAVLDLVGPDEPALVCVFSSVAASAGNAGQGDYAAANEIAERMAVEWRARHPRCLVKAIAWGPWRGGMVGPQLAERFAEHGVPLISLAQGAAEFIKELTADADQVRCLIAAGPVDEPVTRAAETAVYEAAVHEAARTGSPTARPWLRDHRIGERAVVPLAVVCDWMLRLAGEPGPVALYDIDVVRGIAAPAVVTLRRRGSELIAVSDCGGICYRARLAAGTQSGAGRLAGLGRPAGLRPLRRDPVYDGHTLFHGPVFQVLRRIEGVGPAGAAGTVAGADPAQWPHEPWRTDPAALDGAIQLAVLWAREAIGQATLPMVVREAHFRPAGLERGPLRCVVHAVGAGDQDAVCDVLLTRPDGTTVAALGGMQLVARPR